MAEITGLDRDTIKRGLEDMAVDLEEQPEDRQRHVGGGRPRAEKKAAGPADAVAGDSGA